MNANNQPVILSGCRTPSGRFQGSLSDYPAQKLGAIVIAEAIKRAGLKNLEEVNEVLMGNVVSAGLGQNPARQASIHAGIPSTVGATTINKVCGSGLKSVMLAAQAIKAGDADLFLCGGFESMSRAPYLLHGRSGELRFGHRQLSDALLLDGLWDPFEDWSMGNSAEFIAEEFQVTREAMDEYAFQSHQKALTAMDAGRFEEEIVPVEITARKGAITLFYTDETPRRDTTLKALSGLRPAFIKDGKVTAGNAPGLNDGAAAVVVASQSYASNNNLKRMARIVGYDQAAVEPKYLFAAPAKAIPQLLENIGWCFDDVDLFELNEAFAAQVLANGYALADQGWDWEKVNIHGGAIALGHPIGASGARVLVTLIYALKSRDLKRGIAALCLGGGESVALAVEVD
jgi:acetyl-CoA C-acetyltransferase